MRPGCGLLVDGIGYTISLLSRPEETGPLGGVGSLFHFFSAKSLDSLFFLLILHFVLLTDAWIEPCFGRASILCSLTNRQTEPKRGCVFSLMARRNPCWQRWKHRCREFFESNHKATSSSSSCLFSIRSWTLCRGFGLTESSDSEAIFLKGLILAQNERWRRGLGMQVERIPGG